MVNWTVIRATENDAEAIYRHLTESFFLDEPLTMDARGRMSMEDMFALKALPQNLSFIAVDNTGKIVGTALNYDNDNEPECDDPSEDDPFFQELFRMFEYAEKATGKSEPGLMSLHLLSVDKSHRRQGMARKLVEATEDHARNSGFTGVKVECTSKYTADLVSSMNYEKIYGLFYKDFLNDKGEPSFNPPPPHTEFQIFVKRFR
ncbi:uncharacterized protein LOC106673965 [Cimex lectularius]|uniref:aralkylamine N-acetyltransferase n=1 Tax=Cimex lectularius TaxID=79782 RepID=A0A8I6SE00_CIMLE|nr:uncharacterized protein LOC106673965 [Cimex lectularius]